MGFNLGIEYLLFSSEQKEIRPLQAASQFQSRNRVSSLFKVLRPYRTLRPHHVSISESSIFSFQELYPCPLIARSISFNLVIEYLLFSRTLSLPVDCQVYKFQSRNRVSSLFKITFTGTGALKLIKFQSRNRVSSLFKSTLRVGGHSFCQPVSISESSIFSFQDKNPLVRIASTQECFNLVIEYLLFSRKQKNDRWTTLYMSFQSRNRVSSLFKANLGGITLEFQSRNRVSSLFKQKTFKVGRGAYLVSIS